MSKAVRRLLRRESSKLGFTSTIDKNAPPTYVPSLILDKVTNVEDLDHLDEVARKDPLANFITYGVAEMVFDDWFILVDKNGEPVLEEAMRQLGMLNAKRAFTQVLAAERWAGWAYIYTGKNKFIPESGKGGKIGTLQYFTPKNCTVFEYYSELDNIEDPTKRPGTAKTMKVEFDMGSGNVQTSKVLFLPASDFILWNTRPLGRGETGRSIMEAVWDMLTYIRYEFNSMTWFDMKIGAGLFLALTDDSFGDEVLAKWQTAFEDVSNRRALVVDGGQVKDVKFIGPSGSVTDFVQHIDMCIQVMSVPIQIPKDLLVGAAAGAVTGSETNLKLGENLEAKVKSTIEEYIREVISRMGFTDTDYFFDWQAKDAPDKEKESKIEQTHAQAQATKTPYLTVDELREIDGYLPLPDGRGDKLASEQAAEESERRSKFNIGVEGLPSAEDREQTGNEGGTQI